MEFLADYARVTFAGIDKIFEIPAVAFQFTLPFAGGTEVSIRWYGIIIAFGYTLAALFGGRIAYTWKMSLSVMVDVLIYGTFGGIIGARLFYVIFQWDYYAAHPAEIFQLWEGGLAIYGGIIGGFIAAYITCKVEKLSFIKLLDIAGMSLLIGQGIGRWGNFTNQEAFGTNTTLPWGMSSNKVVDYIVRNQAFFEEHNIKMDPAIPVHPTFLYESLWCALGFVILYIMLKKYRKFDGQLFLGYGIWYAIGRSVIEGLRTDSLYIRSVRISQLISILVIAAFAAALVWFSVKYAKEQKKSVLITGKE